jgi:hypothetical protein
MTYGTQLRGPDGPPVVTGATAMISGELWRGTPIAPSQGAR